MNAPAAYVDLLEAVRIVARTLPDGDRLAGAMTDEWITESLFRWNGNYPENDAEMVRLYGGDWRAWRERTRLAYGEACGILAAALRSGKVGGVGGPLGREVDGAREIKPTEWSALRLEVKDNLLDAPLSRNLEGYSAIRSVLVNVEDLRRCAARRARSPGQENKPKVFSEAHCKDWFKARVTGWPPGKPAPSEDDDRADYQKLIGADVPREPFRCIRREAAPHWRKTGPRGPRRPRRNNSAEIIAPE